MTTRKIKTMLDQLTTTNDREIFFPIYEQNVIGGVTQSLASNKKMLTRGPIGEGGSLKDETYLSVVNSKYRVVMNEEILMPLQEQMINHFDPQVLVDVQIKDHITKGGAVCFAEYILPKISQPVETRTGHKTEIGLRYIMKNSHDGSSSVVMYSGDIDFFCTNGQINGQFDVARARHTKNFTIDGFLRAFDQSLLNHSQAVQQYQVWADTQLNSSVKVKELFKKLVNPSIDMGDTSKKSRGLGDRLFAQYTDEIQTRGNNVFSLVSAMTHFASHDDERFGLTSVGDNGTLFKRQQTVNGWLKSKTFEDFLVAA
tara:strand:- start:1184 stop:2122 length:939 start_codon:yes stop_codon:yes gene_type:complete